MKQNNCNVDYWKKIKYGSPNMEMSSNPNNAETKLVKSNGSGLLALRYWSALEMITLNSRSNKYTQTGKSCWTLPRFMAYLSTGNKASY